ncbi:hypothetical protein TKK_0004212 [Trichogramma kaykai]|uniref:PSP proline-rich domain-containing protein n=1 Tax=Trichogramma kaykai TaxID=54128 RepID=A0ABD2XMC7_9HYME
MEKEPEIITLDDSVVSEKSSTEMSNDSIVFIDQNMDNNLSIQEVDDSFTKPEDPLLVEEGELKENEEPAFQIIFRDERSIKNFKDKIENFFKNTLLSKTKKENIRISMENLTLEIYDNGVCNEDFEKQIDDNTSNDDKNTDDCLFFTGNETGNFTLDIPLYEKTTQNPMKETDDDKEEVKKNNFTPKMSCFNCLGNHSMRDCDQPRNPAAINKNRKEHNLKKGSGLRYHMDDEQKFGHFSAGEISSNLREALGIEESELPVHIYRMRQLGYPPGWLEEARLQHSGLAVYSDGNVDHGSDEEGEIILPGDKDKYDIKKIIDFPGFNIPSRPGIQDECIEYWGSVVQVNNSKETMLSHLQHKKADDGYKRKKLSLVPSRKSNSTSLNAGDMEIEQVEETVLECVPANDLFVPPLPKDGNPLPPPPPEDVNVADIENEIVENKNDKKEYPSSLLKSTNDLENDSRTDSPSLLDLESRKKQLLAELEKSNQSCSDLDTSQQSNINTTNDTSQKSNVDELNISQQSITDELNTSQQSNIDDLNTSQQSNIDDLNTSQQSNTDELNNTSLYSNAESSSDLNSTGIENTSSIEGESHLKDSTPKNESILPSKFVSKITNKVMLGTPILKSCSPYKRLPTAEKFSKDICDVINFENLPDSTGKYDQMVGVLEKVRRTVSKLHKE